MSRNGYGCTRTHTHTRTHRSSCGASVRASQGSVEVEPQAVLRPRLRLSQSALLLLLAAQRVRIEHEASRRLTGSQARQPAGALRPRPRGSLAQTPSQAALARPSTTENSTRLPSYNHPKQGGSSGRSNLVIGPESFKISSRTALCARDFRALKKMVPQSVSPRARSRYRARSPIVSGYPRGIPRNSDASRRAPPRDDQPQPNCCMQARTATRESARTATRESALGSPG